MSKSTVSRIEKGDPNVQEETISLYAQQLGHNFEYLKLLFSSKDELKNLKNRLVIVESCVDMRNFESIHELEEIITAPNHPLQQLTHYIRGKAFFYMRKTDRAERELRKAIEIARKYSDHFGYMNIAACSHNILSNIYFWTKGPTAALEAVEKGIQFFDRNGERQDTYYMILVNKATYLEKLGRYGELDDVMDQLLVESDRITRSITRSAFFELLAKKKIRDNQPKEALDFALKSFRIASENGLYDRTFQSLLVIGDIYHEMDQPNQAEKCYQKALVFSTKIRNHLLIADAYIRLGKLYVALDKIDHAEKAFNQANAIEALDDHHKCEIMLGIGEILFKKEKYHSAIRPLSQAHQLARLILSKEKERDSLVFLCQCYEKVDETAHFHHLKMLQQVIVELRGKGKQVAC